MKKVLIVGNSLTAGHPGVSFVHILTKLLSGHQVMAHGRGGSTLLGISRRLHPLLNRHAPDIVIIEAGVNDLILPWFGVRGGPWKILAHHLQAFGEISTTEVSSFQSLYAEVIEKVKQHPVEIVMTTITCVGEDLNSGLSRLRAQYNGAIRRLAETCNVHLADVGRVFDGILGDVDASSAYLLDEYYKLYLDTLLTRVDDTAADSLSTRRGLVLTLDGVHLNRRGAQAYAEVLLETLRGLDS